MNGLSNCHQYLQADQKSVHSAWLLFLVCIYKQTHGLLFLEYIFLKQNSVLTKANITQISLSSNTKS